MSKIKSTVKKTYSNEYLAKNLKSCLQPLLEQRAVIKKWDLAIPDFIRETKQGSWYTIEEVEENLSIQVKRKTYKNLFKTINDSASVLIGKTILQKDVSNKEIEKLMLAINDGLYDMHRINDRLESWLYYEAEATNSVDYADLCDIIVNVEKAFHTIYKKYDKMKMKTEEFKSESYYATSYIKEIYFIYKRLLKLASKIFKLDPNDRLYPYFNTLEDFAINLMEELIYITGEIYLEAENVNNITSMSKDKITKYFENLEKKHLKNSNRLSYLFYEIDKNSNYGTKKDNELLYAYQELKAATNTMIFSSWK